MVKAVLVSKLIHSFIKQRFIEKLWPGIGDILMTKTDSFMELSFQCKSANLAD